MRGNLFFGMGTAYKFELLSAITTMNGNVVDGCRYAIDISNAGSGAQTQVGNLNISGNSFICKDPITSTFTECVGLRGYMDETISAQLTMVGNHFGATHGRHIDINQTAGGTNCFLRLNIAGDFFNAASNRTQSITTTAVGTDDFSVGDVIQGDTSGAQGTIVAITGSSPTYTFEYTAAGDTSVVFQTAAEGITNTSATGTATKDGNPPSASAYESIRIVDETNSAKIKIDGMFEDTINSGLNLTAIEIDGCELVELNGLFETFDTGISLTADSINDRYIVSGAFKSVTNDIVTSGMSIGQVQVRDVYSSEAPSLQNQVASASPLVIPDNTSKGFTVTGTTGFNTISPTRVDRKVTLKFNGSLTMTDGTGNLQLAGGVNFVSTGNDTITLWCDGTNWYETGRSVN